MTDTLLEFPCAFPIKVVGLQNDSFRSSLEAVLAATDIEVSSIAERPSSRGNYLSLTVTVQARSQQQLDELYRQLTALADVKMVL